MLTWEWIETRAIGTILSAVNLFILFIVLPTIRVMGNLRAKDLNSINDALTRLETRLTRIEDQLHNHYQFHISRKDP